MKEKPKKTEWLINYENEIRQHPENQWKNSIHYLIYCAMLANEECVANFKIFTRKPFQGGI